MDTFRQGLWIEMQRRLAYVVGRQRLSLDPQASQIEDVLRFLSECSDEHFLDFIEFIFQVDFYPIMCRGDENTMVDDINHLLLLDDLPYAITPFIRETAPQEVRALV